MGKRNCYSKSKGQSTSYPESFKAPSNIAKKILHSPRNPSSQISHMLCTIKHGNLVSLFLAVKKSWMIMIILSALSGAFSGPSPRGQGAGATGVNVSHLSFEFVNLDV